MRTSALLSLAMPTRLRRCVVGVALLGAAAGLPEAQTPRPYDAPIRFRHLGLEQGLPHPDVHTIHQDATGFLWFGTEDGLARYDGTALRVYRSVPFDTTSIPNPWVVDLADAPEDGLWVASESGDLARYDPRADAFVEPFGRGRVSSLWALLAPPEGPLWLGGRTSGLYRADPLTGTVDVFAHDAADPTSLAGLQITALLSAEGGGVWVGTQRDGLDLWQPRARAFRHHRSTPGDDGSLPSDYVTALFRARDGRLWVGTHAGLAVYENGRFTVPEVADPARGTLRDDAIWSILEDPAGALWLGTSNGLVRYDPASGTLARHIHDPADPTSLGAGDVRALLLDRSGVLWAATESGLSAFVWAAPPFERVAPGPSGTSAAGIWSFLVARDGALWVGTESGLDRFGASGEVTYFRHVPGDAGSISPGWVIALREAADGTLWVGTRSHETQPGALQRVDPATGRVLERFVADPEDPTSLPSDNPWALFEDRQGRLWVLSGGSGCPSLFDRSARSFTPYCLTEGGESYVAKSAVERPDGTLLLGTWGNGLAHLDPASGEITFLHHDPADTDTPASDYLLVARADARGTIWLGTYGAGLSRYDPPEGPGQRGTFRHYATSTSDLPNDVVYAIEVDAAGDLWLSTNAGLTRFSPSTETFESFGLDDGLQDLEFNAASSLRAASGELFFGGINGFNRFVPDRVASGDGRMPVVLTEVRVDGAPLAPAADGPMAVAAPYASEVRLDARQRDISFSFAALSYRAPERVRYRVKLEGYDEDWHEPSARNAATYTNLDPGTYTFQVQATGTAGVWTDGGAALAIVVTPRFYEAAWFRLLVALGLVGLVAAVVAARERERRATQRHLEAQVAERTEDLRAEKRTTEAQADRLREMDRLKTRFFTNVSHEFRTPLTLTIGPLEDLQADAPSLPGRARTLVDLALRNSRRLLRLINQLLDVARLEAGEMRLDAHPLDLGEAVRALTLSFAPLAERHRITLETETPETAVWAQADPEKLEHIVINLLSNAFKFTPAGGRIRVDVTERGGQAEVSVRDSGPGIAEADLARVFDRFYQTDEAAPGGSGIGLSLARDFAELHGGTLSAESTIGFGALFTLRVPLAARTDVPTAGAPTARDLSGDGEATRIPTLASPEDDALGEDAPGDDRMMVLIADDNADIRAYVRGHLAARYRILEAPDGATALALARTHLPDLIVSDVMMPQLDGVSLVRALRADRETDFLPVVLLTAKADEADQVEGLAAGADAYVVKPFNVHTLQARIDGLIASHQRLRGRLAETLAKAERPGEARPATDQPVAIQPTRAAQAETEIVTRVRQAIEARLGDENLTVEDVAAALGMSRSTLHRRLRDAADQTPTALLRSIRLTHAAALLRAASGTVGEVAYAVGFKSVSHFSHAFRARYGVSPSAYGERQADAAPPDRTVAG